MSIKPSAAAEIRTLVDALSAADDIRREAAIARLTVIGPRAVDRLLASYASPDTTRATRVAILRVLESIGDSRALSVATAALHEGGDLAIAAAGALRALLASGAGDVSTDSLDALVATALDRAVERRVRMAAYEALREVPGDVRERIAVALQQDPDKTFTGQLTQAGRDMSAEVIWQDALEGQLPDDPRPLREVAQARAPSAPLGVLQKLVEGVRKREADPMHEARAPEWQALRGALHQALALRASRIALYDLRETLEAATAPLPGTYVTALHLIGDESCLQPIAAAHNRTSDLRWRRQLADAFTAIVKREKLSRKPVAKLLTSPEK